MFQVKLYASRGKSFQIVFKNKEKKNVNIQNDFNDHTQGNL